MRCKVVRWAQVELETKEEEQSSSEGFEVGLGARDQGKLDSRALDLASDIFCVKSPPPPSENHPNPRKMRES